MKVSEKDTNVGIGTPSVILIVIVLAMVVFALLAFRSARAEMRLADKTAKSVRDYYELESTAEELIAEIDEALAEGGSESAKLQKIEALEAVTGTEVRKDGNARIYAVSMYVKTSKDSDMGISAEVDFTKNGGDFDIKEWRYIKEEPEGGYELMLPD